MIRTTLRSLLARKLRLALSASAVVLGVAFVAGALVLTDTLGAAFTAALGTVDEEVAVDVRGSVAAADGPAAGQDRRREVPDAAVAAVEGVEGVDGVAEVQGWCARPGPVRSACSARTAPYGPAPAGR